MNANAIETMNTASTNTISIYNRTCAYLGHLNPRSQWERAVRNYAIELMENLTELDNDDFASPSIVQRALLNGASDWQEYSEGGCSLIYDWDIAERLCTPSTLKKMTHADGSLREHDWIGDQARALYQASRLIMRKIERLNRLNNN